ncbi:MAG: hypothetical protein ACE5GL_09160, partial [Calditrichia bacterium]
MDLAGNFRIAAQRVAASHTVRPAGLFPSFQSVIFSLSVILLLLGGCARQVSRPAPEQEQISEPIIRVCIDENFENASLSFEGHYTLRLEEALYDLDNTVGALTVTPGNRFLTIENDLRFFKFDPP